MSEPEFLNLLHKIQLICLEIAGTLSFFVVLWQVLSKHFHFRAFFLRLAWLVIVLSDEDYPYPKRKPYVTSNARRHKKLSQGR